MSRYDQDYINARYASMREHEHWLQHQQALRDSRLNARLHNADMEAIDNDLEEQLLYLHRTNPQAYKAALSTKAEAEQVYFDSLMSSMNGDYKVNEGEFVEEEESSDRYLEGF